MLRQKELLGNLWTYGWYLRVIYRSHIRTGVIFDACTYDPDVRYGSCAPGFTRRSNSHYSPARGVLLLTDSERQKQIAFTRALARLFQGLIIESAT